MPVLAPQEYLEKVVDVGPLERSANRWYVAAGCFGVLAVGSLYGYLQGESSASDAQTLEFLHSSGIFNAMATTITFGAYCVRAHEVNQVIDYETAVTTAVSATAQGEEINMRLEEIAKRGITTEDWE